MERLRIKNFLIIEEADFDVGRFNIIIGSQASGKSVIAKLLYFFRANYWFNKVQESDISLRFEKIFPKCTWEKQTFEIYYQSDKVENKLNYDGKMKWSFSENQEVNRSLFIPANRSLLSFIHKNIFTLIKEDAEIDYFIACFGESYLGARNVYSLNENEFIRSLVENILGGEYVYKSGQDWIKVNNQFVRLHDASSGQQEVLPMLITLAFLIKFDISISTFIEEPETNLFPVSQKQIIELLSLLYNQGKHKFILTTHNPYILTAINNAILAQDVIAEKGKEAVKAIFDPDFAIKYEDVRAYTIENGKLISILDDETRLIGASVVDSVSDEFENVFNSLLEL